MSAFVGATKVAPTGSDASAAVEVEVDRHDADGLHGLSVAHRIVQEHHGVIDVESAVRRGTTFHIAFPLLRQEAAV